MLFSFLILAIAANPQQSMPTQGLLATENIDCMSSQISAEQAQDHYALASAGKEIEAYNSVQDFVKACRAKYGWSDIQTRNAFRVSIMDGWMLTDGLIENIQKLGDFKPWLDEYYDRNVLATEQQMLKDIFHSGKMDEDLSAAGYPAADEMREWAYQYFEWRGTLAGIEDDFRNGRLRR
ncbi:MAG: hypothetical protein AB8B54_07360 [Sphingorhabdus sp.]